MGRRARKTPQFRRLVAAFALGLFTLPSASAVSLWNEKTGGLFSAKREFKPGDIVMIVVEESTNARQDWSQEREKQVDIAASTDATGLGAGTKNLIGRFLPFMGGQYQSEFQSENESDRQTVVRARVAAEVVNIQPNGNLQIIARKVTRVNSEEQLIELTGSIRPEDVSPRNIVSSTAIADAEIKVNGTWRYTNESRPSVLEKLFSWLTGLFF